MFHGSITAIITPFREGAVDWQALDGLIDFQVDQGSHGIVACGTTGESPTLSAEEHNSIVVRCIERVKGRIPVIAGTGTNSTTSTIENTLHAQKAGADAALIVTPYYNKPTQEGLYAHYKAVHDATNIPILIYNIPGRCVIDMNVDTMARLAELPRIVGVKDATGDLERPAALKRAIGKDFCQLSGNDDTALAYRQVGGHGCISVISNIAPAMCAELHQAWDKGDHKTAEALRDRMEPLNRALFIEASPAPIKYACARAGLCTDEMRLPMLPASAKARQAVDEALDFAGLSTPESAEKARRRG